MHMLRQERLLPSVHFTSHFYRCGVSDSDATQINRRPGTIRSRVARGASCHVLLEVQAAPKDPWQITKNRNVTVAIEEENIQLPKNTVPQTTIGIRWQRE